MTDFRILKKYHAYLKPFLVFFLIAIVFDIFMTLLGLTTPLFIRLLFDYAYPYKDLSLLNTAIIAVIVIYFVYFFFSVASDYLQMFINQEVIAGLTEKVYHTIQCLPLKFHMEKKSGDLLIRITDDVPKAVNMIMRVLPTIIIDGGRFVIILLISLYINSKLTILAMLSIPLYVLEARFYAGRIAQVETEYIDAESNIYSRTQERLSNIQTIKAFSQERMETLSFATLIRRRFTVSIKGKFLDVIRTFTNSITLQMWSVFLTWYLGYQVVGGLLTIGEIVALMLYIDQLEGPIHSFINLFTEWKTNLVSMRRLNEVLDQQTEETDDAKLKEITISNGQVMTSRLSFSYTSDHEILHDIDINFEPHSVTAIVGGSGSGKTTLANLIIRFFDPSHGMILIDGQNILEARIHSVRNKIGIVSQNAAIFDGTVMDNILYGSEGKERGDAMRAARLAGAHEFIEHLPGGYDAPTGFDGGLLSVGQRQRITIARALLKDPKIIIFDEATSGLDAESEFRIGEAVSGLRKTKTVIVIAHRLSTIKTADNILVLEDGKFVESGNFEDLIEKRGAFYRFYWLQFGGLSIFRQHLELEIERTARYGSKFCFSVLKIRKYADVLEKEGMVSADRFMEKIDFLLKKSIRIGDISAIFGHDTILILLPEIESAQLDQFFTRMLKIMPRPVDPEMPYPLDANDMCFTGVRITKKHFRTPEELIQAINTFAQKSPAAVNATVVDEEELAKVAVSVD